MTVGGVTPWWEVLRLRSEVVNRSGTIDDVQMSLYRAVHDNSSDGPPYADAGYYGEITHPSVTLVELLARVAVRLGGGARYAAAPALRHLDQAMGGGKSHGLIGLWHLAAHTNAFRQTEIGRRTFETAARIAGHSVAPTLEDPQVVVLSCDSMTPGAPDPHYDGPARTLHERFLWRLFGGDHTLYRRYASRPDQAGVTDALQSIARPVLILVDEIMDYVRRLSASEHADLAVEDMAFVKALLDVVNDVPRIAMIVVMIKSEDDLMALDRSAKARREELAGLLVRNGETATVTGPTDFNAILHRRLFEGTAPPEVVAATVNLFRAAMQGTWDEQVFSRVPRHSLHEIGGEIERCYPFHPSLIGLAEQEWSTIAGFQRVRSTIRIFAATVYHLRERARAGGWVPLLIAPGDLPLSKADVREAVVGSGLIADPRTQANYRMVAATDIVGDGDASGNARRLDLHRTHDATFALVNPRAAERAATALFLYSVAGHRGQGRQGATEAEVKAATFVPESAYGVADADVVLDDLVGENGLAAIERQRGQGGQPPRLLLSTRQTLTMFYRAQRNAVSEIDRDEELWAATERLVRTGPFRDKIPVMALEVERDPRSLREILETAGIDDARITRLVVLDPRRFSLLNGSDRETRDALQAALGIGPRPLPVAWAASAVFAVMNTQRRRMARVQASEYLAWKRAAEIQAVLGDETMKSGAEEKRDTARADLERSIRQGYQHVVYLGVGEDSDSRAMRELRLEQENQTALNGLTVWAKLTEVGRAFGQGAFDARVLLHNLTEADYGRPLDELRNLFWSTPRLPLLHEGEADLQAAIFESIQGGKLRLVGEDGSERVVTRASDIGVNSASLRLARPLPLAQPTDIDIEGGTHLGGGSAGIRESSGTGSRGSGESSAGATDIEPTAEDVEVGLRFTLRKSLTDADDRSAAFLLLDELAHQVDVSASYAQITVDVTLPRSSADALVKLVRDAGANANITEI